MQENSLSAVEQAFRRAVERMGGRAGAFLPSFAGLDEETALYLKYLCACMPASDMANCDGALLLAFARHARMLRRTMPWCSTIPDEVSFPFVLSYRVNNEAVEFSRGDIFRQLCKRVDGLAMEQAALEVNYWCGEKAVYHPSDERTSTPASVIRNARGRCGEESTLTVTALRSVGIPARQCYVPRWAHCDDNHAWVEVWVDGRWHYMGACEPEPMLDKGWFTFAASRAMLVHYRLFSSLWQPPEATFRNGGLCEINDLAAYADTAMLTVAVEDEAGRPVPGARVCFEIVNYAELYPLAVCTTGKDGCAAFRSGKGTLCVHASHGELLGRTCVDLSRQTRAVIRLEPMRAAAYDFRMAPPAGRLPESEAGMACPPEHRQKLAVAESRREAYTAGFCSPEEAAAFSARFAPYADEVAGWMRQSRGNRRELARFLEIAEPLPLKAAMLRTLTEKDLTDLKPEVLADHIRRAAVYRDRWPADIFESYVLCPRVEWETLTAYRGPLADAFEAERQAYFRADPARVWAWIEREIADAGDDDYTALSAAPARLMQMKRGSLRSRRVLFVGICRTLGIPARLDPAYAQPQYYAGTAWHTVGWRAAPAGTLTLRRREGDPLEYGLHFTVARLEAGAFSTVGCDGVWENDTLVLSLPAGWYRLLTANRQIDGSILCTARIFRIEAGHGVEMPVGLRPDELKSLLRDLPLPDHTLTDTEGRPVSLHALTAGAPAVILAVLRPGAEPTAHLLNEMAKLGRLYRESGFPLLLLAGRDAPLTDRALRRVMDAIPAARLLFFADDAFSDRLCREMESGDHRLPLAAVLGPGCRMRFCFANYNVGTAELLLRIAACGI